MSASFTVYPAIDVRDGRVVRLRQGDFAQETRYGDDPLAIARAYAEAGASWLHLVDLDAARTGGYALAPLVSRIKCSTALAVQTGGGVRCVDDVAKILDAGADRVVVGSVAVRQPDSVCEWIARFGTEKLVAALDTRIDAQGRWRLPVHGWTETGSGPDAATLEPLVVRLAASGLRHLLCTDIARDGMLSGPNIVLYRELCALAPSLAVQASGGARDMDDVDAARAAGCAGVVLGRALLEGRIALAEAVAC